MPNPELATSNQKEAKAKPIITKPKAQKQHQVSFFITNSEEREKRQTHFCQNRGGNWQPHSQIKETKSGTFITDSTVRRSLDLFLQKGNSSISW